MEFKELLAKFRAESKDERTKGTKFELFCVKFLREYKIYKQEFEKVDMWSNWGFGESDCGIDIVAKTHNGEYVAIQCKFYDEKTAIDLNDISNFLSTKDRTFNIDGKTIQFNKLYLIDTANNLTTEPTKTFSNINNFGKTRLILDEKIKFGKVVFKFKCNYKSNINDSVVYPFGIKHIFFKEADFITESCAIVHARFNDYVEYIEDKIVLYTPTGKIETNCSYYGIEAYTTYENNTLMNKVQYSTNAGIYRIPKNTMSLYFKIPLYIKNDADDTKEYLCLNGLKVNISTKDILLV